MVCKGLLGVTLNEMLRSPDGTGFAHAAPSGECNQG